MSELIVLSHEHDPDEGVYRLTVGYEVLEDRVITDDDGAPVYATEDPDERAPDELPLTEQVVVGHVATEDFVWADNDERWADKTPGEVAESQVRSVRYALRKREEEAREREARAAAREQLGTAGRTVLGGGD